jgi:hypothetical protein
MSATEGSRRVDRRGNYTILVGSLMFVVVGFAAFSVDIAMITMAELQAQAAADAASHAALIAFRQNNVVTEGNSAANFIMGVDHVAMKSAVIEPGYPEYGQYDFELRTFSPGLSTRGGANAVRVEVSRRDANAVQMLLAPLIGYDDKDVTAQAITAQQERAIMLVQDMSCSMMDSTTTSAVNISRLANQTFLSYLMSHPQEGDMLGLAMFAQLAARPPASGTPAGSGTNTFTTVPWAPLLLVDGNASLLHVRIDGICNTQTTTQPCPISGQYHPTTATIGSCTNPEPALGQAINELTTKTDDTYFRGIVFMSDGVPNCGASGATDTTSATNRAYAQANAAWNEDISIWSILYHNGDFDPAFMDAMVRGSGFSQISPDAADLPAMYEEVAKSLPTALVE